MKTRAAAALAAVCLTGLGSSGCTREAPRPSGIVLITIDTTRADHIGCYGAKQAETPRLDRLAAEGVRFETATSAVPTTLASHATMFTGLYPPRHGVRYNGMFRLGAGTATVASALRAAGWATAGVPAAFPVTQNTGIGEGFETYRDLFREERKAPADVRDERSAEEVTAIGLEWLRARDGRPFFLWLHYFDPHAPYAPPFPWSSRFRDRLYDGEIAYVDASIGRLLDGLDTMGLSRTTVVIVAGDHGEGLFEHGERMHGNLVYQGTLHVPLIVRGPGVRGGAVVREAVGLADIGPTILDLAGAAAPRDADGRSLRPALSGAEPERRALYFETLAGSLVSGWSPLEGLRRGRWKYIASSEPELYDLESDPSEAANVVAQEGDVAKDLAASLETLRSGWAARSPASTVVDADPETLAQLASLGYVGGSAATASAGGPNPRRVIFLEGDLLQIRDLMLDRDYVAALPSIANVLGHDPGNRFALHQAVLAKAALGDAAGAIAAGRELVRRYPEFVPGVGLLAELLGGQGRLADAESVLRAGLEKSPDDPVLLHPLALVAAARGRPAEALAIVDRALSRPAAPPVLYVTRALALIRRGDRAGAVAALREALAHGYRDRAALETEPLLAPLRAMPEYAGIVSGLASPEKPR